MLIPRVPDRPPPVANALIVVGEVVAADDVENRERAWAWRALQGGEVIGDWWLRLALVNIHSSQSGNLFRSALPF